MQANVRVDIAERKLLLVAVILNKITRILDDGGDENIFTYYDYVFQQYGGNVRIYLKQELAKNADNINNWIGLGYYHYKQIQSGSKEPIDKQAVISCYKKFLELSPEDNKCRDRVEKMLEEVDE